MRLNDRRYRVKYVEGFAAKGRTLLSGQEFQLDSEALARYFFADLPPRLQDFLRIGMAIDAVDRDARRGGSWARDLQVQIKVVDPDFWSSREVLDSLRGAVEFVTGDSWDFDFFGGTSSPEWGRPLLSKVFAGESPLVCLYSGGLDSAAGLALRAIECPDRPLLPVTIKHQPRQLKLIEGQFKQIENRLGAKVEPLIIRTIVRHLDGVKWEPSHRGRSLLFASAGAVAAALAGGSTVEIFESGVGAINVPLMAGMTGSKATRGCHPEFLHLVSNLASLVAEREITFRLPFLDRTKGDMVSSLNEVGLAELARSTISCALYPIGYRRYRQCGVCPACLFRRQALLAGGVEEAEGTYSFDLFGSVECAELVPTAKLKYLKAFLMQVAEWTDIETTSGLPGAVERHLLHTKILGPGESPESVIALLARYRDEWMAIAEEGRRRGLPWAKLLDRKRVERGVSHASA